MVPRTPLALKSSAHHGFRRVLRTAADGRRRWQFDPRRRINL
jgi:hypothetical protein